MKKFFAWVKENNGTVSVMEQLGEKKSATYWRAAFLLSVAELVMLTFKSMFNKMGTPFDILFPAILAFMLILLCAVQQMLIRYRAKHGFLGTNTDEAKELIYFILESQKQTATDDEMKFNFSLKDLVTSVVRESSGGEVHV